MMRLFVTLLLLASAHCLSDELVTFGWNGVNTIPIAQHLFPAIGSTLRIDVKTNIT